MSFSDWWEDKINWPLQQFFFRGNRPSMLHRIFSKLDLLQMYGIATLHQQLVAKFEARLEMTVMMLCRAEISGRWEDYALAVDMLDKIQQDSVRKTLEGREIFDKVLNKTGPSMMIAKADLLNEAFEIIDSEIEFVKTLIIGYLDDNNESVHYINKRKWPCR